MTDILKRHITTKLDGNPDNLDLVLNCFKPLYADRNTFLLREGEVCRKVFFICKGCLQVFVYDKEMSETSRDIVTEDSWCSELISFGTAKPSTENIRTVEPRELLVIDRTDFQKMMETVPQFDQIYKQILEISYANSVYRINTFVALSALDRIKRMMEFRPSLMTRVSSKLIASYLGIHKDVFSRLKARL